MLEDDEGPVPASYAHVEPEPVDLTVPHWIRVTADAIRRGRRRLPWYCPIARAANRLVGQNCHVERDGIHCSYYGGRIFAFSRATRRWLDRFDRGVSVQPIRFRAMPVRRSITEERTMSP